MVVIQEKVTNNFYFPSTGLIVFSFFMFTENVEHGWLAKLVVQWIHMMEVSGSYPVQFTSLYVFSCAKIPKLSALTPENVRN